MKKLIIALTLISTTAIAGPRYYTEYKNNSAFIDDHYIDNSSINSARLGIQGENLYFEAGGSEFDGEFGYSFETGYKFKFQDKYELKGKIEGIDKAIDSKIPWKSEAEFRYYFN